MTRYPRPATDMQLSTDHTQQGLQRQSQHRWQERDGNVALQQVMLREALQDSCFRPSVGLANGGLSGLLFAARCDSRCWFVR